MSIEEIIIDKVRILPPDKQQEALDFVEFLLAKMQKQELSDKEKIRSFGFDSSSRIHWLCGSRK